MDLPGPVQWEGDTAKLVLYTNHAKNPNFPYNYRRSARYKRVPGRKITSIYIHQTAGPSRNGVDACDRLASWITRSPKYEMRRGKKVRVGGGRGFPGAPYTFLIPTRPDVHEGKFVIYQLWNEEWQTWATRRQNRNSVSVAFAGSFETRHSRKFSDRDPLDIAMAAGTSLVQDYLLPRYGLTVDDVMGHFDAGKPTCPGDALEAWIRELRGEKVSWREHQDHTDRRPLETLSQKIDALKDLGHGDEWDLSCREDRRMAIESVQEEAGIVVDGIWGPQTEKAVRVLLSAKLS